MEEFTFNDLPAAFTLLLEKVNTIEQLLKEKNIPSKEEPDQILTIKEAATEVLHLKVQTIYGLVHRGEIPVCKRGNKLYFSKNDLTSWIKKGKKKTFVEIESESNQYIKRRGKWEGSAL